MSDYNRNAANPFGAGAARAGSAVLDQGLRAYMLGVYNNMAIGLAITGLVAYGTNLMSVVNTSGGRLALTPFGETIYRGPLHWVVMFAPLAFVLFFSFRIDRMAAGTARAMFFAFSAVMGLSLSVILLVYTQSSIANAFFVTAATFGGLSLLGYTTKKDLSAMGAFLGMTVIGLIIASIVNIFLQNSMFQMALSALTVLIFAGLTAYDTQSIKEMYYEGDSHDVATRKSINGALRLYLDFINIFTSLLQLMGDRR